MTSFISYYLDQIPGVLVWLQVGLPALLFAALALGASGWCKRRGWKTGYTRKIFHFVIFFVSAPMQVYFGLPEMIVYGVAVSLIVFYALYRGKASAGYRALARENDAPYERRYILIPWMNTAIGGLLANYFFMEFAVVGYLVAGFGDALAEPVGTRWGNHPYDAPDVGKVRSIRTIEGSAAVLFGSMIAVAVGLWMIQQMPPMTFHSLGILFAVSVTAMIVEASSPHGWDNLTMMVFPTWLAHYWLSMV